MRPKQQTQGGFVQWKPVCYQKHTRSRNVATTVKKYQLGDTHNVTELLMTSVAHAFYGSQLSQKGVAKHSLNISFGLSKDGTYFKTNYLSWWVHREAISLQKNYCMLVMWRMHLKKKLYKICFVWNPSSNYDLSHEHFKIYFLAQTIGLF